MKKLLLTLLFTTALSLTSFAQGSISTDGEGCTNYGGQYDCSTATNCTWIAGHYQSVTTVYAWWFGTPILWSTEQVWVTGHYLEPECQ